MNIRGAIGETLYAQARFGTGDTVTIVLYDASDGSSVGLDSNSCTQMGTTGEFVWGTDNLTAQPVSGETYIWVMSNSGGDTKRGQITFYVAQAGTSPADIWTYATRELTAGTKDAEIDQIINDIDALKDELLDSIDNIDVSLPESSGTETDSESSFWNRNT
jgi:hypothetical protein